MNYYSSTAFIFKIVTLQLGARKSKLFTISSFSNPYDLCFYRVSAIIAISNLLQLFANSGKYYAIKKKKN